MLAYWINLQKNLREEYNTVPFINDADSLHQYFENNFKDRIFRGFDLQDRNLVETFLTFIQKRESSSKLKIPRNWWVVYATKPTNSIILWRPNQNFIIQSISHCSLIVILNRMVSLKQNLKTLRARYDQLQLALLHW